MREGAVRKNVRKMQSNRAPGHMVGMVKKILAIPAK